MARAWRCDICGRLYEAYTKNVWRAGESNSIAYVHKGINDWGARKLFDCCPICFNSITNYIEDLMESKEKENA